MPFLARQLAERHAEAFSSAEHARLAQDAVAHVIRFGQAQAAAQHGPGRFTGTDTALAANAALPGDIRSNPNAHFDRLVALRDRVRMQEAVQLFESLRAAGAVIPPYARIAAADAYLYLQQPEKARDLYVEGLRDAGSTEAETMLNAQISLAYAYNEAGQHAEAENLAERLLRQTPEKIHAGLRGLEAPNPEYTRVRLLRALLHLYNDRLAQAERQLAGLRMSAPFNQEIRAAWASLQAARERPRAALEEYSLLLTDRPQALDAAVGQAEMHLGLHELARARESLPRMASDYPENRAVQNLVRQVGIYDSPYFRMSATVGRGARALGAESLYDAALYSAPLSASLGERFRVFGNVARASGAEPERGEARTRRGIGIDYRAQDFSAEAQVTDATGTGNSGGILLRLSGRLSDAWQAGAALDTNVIDMPAGAMREGISGKALKIHLAWRLNESRQAGGEWQRLRYSDGNVRDAAGIWWKERWISGPVHRLESVLSLAAGSNDAGPRAYFNPDRDAELNLRLMGERLSWRRQQRWFKQRAIASFGQYHQSGIGSGAAADLRYEHEWGFDQAYGLQYGAGRSFHPYDGKREYRSYLYVTLYGSLK